jgi:uncharacterized protein RhaS with RHS repeats
MGERYYDPTLGRFTQLDPLGNGYVYSQDDPVNFSDPSGLEEIGNEGIAGVELGPGGGSVEASAGDSEPKGGHSNEERPSTTEKHEQGESRRKADQDKARGTNKNRSSRYDRGRRGQKGAKYRTPQQRKARGKRP